MSAVAIRRGNLVERSCILLQSLPECASGIGVQAESGDIDMLGVKIAELANHQVNVCSLRMNQMEAYPAIKPGILRVKDVVTGTLVVSWIDWVCA